MSNTIEVAVAEETAVYGIHRSELHEAIEDERWDTSIAIDNGASHTYIVVGDLQSFAARVAVLAGGRFTPTKKPRARTLGKAIQRGQVVVKAGDIVIPRNSVSGVTYEVLSITGHAYDARCQLKSTNSGRQWSRFAANLDIVELRSEGA